jgi:hypothetical protein
VPSAAAPIVYPSGFEFATTVMPSDVAAPGLLTTTIF